MIPNLKSKLDLLRKEKAERPQEPLPVQLPSECRVIRRLYAYGEDLGPREAFDAMEARAVSCLSRTPLCADSKAEDLCFLDTETTGLSAGAGTLAFLVGLGYFTAQGFVTEQYFMEEVHQEKDQMRRLAEKLSDFSVLCTYNGKTFDIPLLESRAAFHRIKLPIEDKPHLDLLFAARRLFRRKLTSCSLGSVEEAVLSRGREDDIPGAEIPAAYAQYLRDRQEGPIERILEHNRLDIVSLAELLRCLEMYQRRWEATLDAELLFACAMNALEAGEDAAEEMLRRASLTCEEAAQQYIWLLKRKERWEEAYDVCLAWSEAHSGGLAVLELRAKLEEHQRKDYAAALATSERALSWCVRAGSPAAWENWVHRKKRLKRKLTSEGNS